MSTNGPIQHSGGSYAEQILNVNMDDLNSIGSGGQGPKYYGGAKGFGSGGGGGKKRGSFWDEVKSKYFIDNTTKMDVLLCKVHKLRTKKHQNMAYAFLVI